MIVALAGGVGGARLALGLAAELPPQRLAIVVNTGDDFEHLGLAISPDIDTVTYTLAGLNNPALGWGRVDETWSFMETLAALGGETWFRLGDRDLALHVLRTAALARGERLSDVTRLIAERLGVRHAIVPMSDDSVRTFVMTDRGELAFQDYFVRLRCEPRVTGFRFDGSENARVPPMLAALCSEANIEAAVICPSNPYVSIEPILTVQTIRAWLERRRFPVIAVSPIVGGVAVKGPAAKMMHELGFESSAAAVAQHYGDLVDAWIVDRADAALAHEIQRLGPHVEVADTMMTDAACSAALARVVVDVARRVRARVRPA